MKRDTVRVGNINIRSARRDSTAGAMIFECTPARYDNVQIYATTVDFRPRREVTDSESLRSWENALAYNEHLVSTMATVGQAIGYIKGVHDNQRGGLDGLLVVTDPDTIERILSGEWGALSAGYDVEPDKTPGVYDGVSYTEVQRRIRINHLAIGPLGVDWARAGAAARVKP